MQKQSKKTDKNSQSTLIAIGKFELKILGIPNYFIQSFQNQVLEKSI